MSFYCNWFSWFPRRWRCWSSVADEYWNYFFSIWNIYFENTYRRNIGV